MNWMIEFKQIIGRDTRLYDGKDYFTIYDSVKANYHFNDPEWDGEPEDNTPQVEGEGVPVTEPGPPDVPREQQPPKGRPKVKLGDGKERPIQHMVATTFWHPNRAPMSAQEFMEMLFGKLPEFFKSEAELRALWR